LVRARQALLLLARRLARRLARQALPLVPLPLVPLPLPLALAPLLAL
jgi:hypothetical protein